MFPVKKVRFSKLKMVNKNSLINSELKKTSITFNTCSFNFDVSYDKQLTINVIKTRPGEGYPFQS